MTDVIMAMSTGKKIEMKSEEIKDWNIPLTVDWGACAKQPPRKVIKVRKLTFM
jgi:hypothetical protein